MSSGFGKHTDSDSLASTIKRRLRSVSLVDSIFEQPSEVPTPSECDQIGVFSYIFCNQETTNPSIFQTVEVGQRVINEQNLISRHPLTIKMVNTPSILIADETTQETVEIAKINIDVNTKFTFYSLPRVRGKTNIFQNTDLLFLVDSFSHNSERRNNLRHLFNQYKKDFSYSANMRLLFVSGIEPFYKNTLSVLKDEQEEYNDMIIPNIVDTTFNHTLKNILIQDLYTLYEGNAKYILICDDISFPSFEVISQILDYKQHHVFIGEQMKVSMHIPEDNSNDSFTKLQSLLTPTCLENSLLPCSQFIANDNFLFTSPTFFYSNDVIYINMLQLLITDSITINDN
ncbi:hypothetical protein WA158_007212 [Blastocystis sp. Blastoise]